MVCSYSHFVRFAASILSAHLGLAAVRCLSWVLSPSPDIGTIPNGWYFLSPSCTLPSHPASVMVTLREIW